MERFLEREPRATSTTDDARCPSPCAAAAADREILRPERRRTRRHSSCAEDHETVDSASRSSSDANRMIAGFDSDSGCGASEPPSPYAAAAVASTTSGTPPATCRSEAGSAGVVVVVACRCSLSQSRRCRRGASRPRSEPVDDVADRCALQVASSRAHRCSFQGCRKMYTKRSHLKSHLRTHTGRWLNSELHRA